MLRQCLRCNRMDHLVTALCTSRIAMTWKQFYIMLRMLKCSALCYLIYLQKMANWDDVFGDDLGKKCASYHTDLCEKLHGLSSYLLKIKQTLSAENLENYNLFTKNHLLEFLNYLEVCYPSVHELVLDICMNEKITHLMDTAKKNKKNLKQQKIQNIMNKLMTKTDHIRVNAEKQRIENQRQKSKEIKQKQKKQKKTKTARHMSSKENKKQKKKQAEMKAMRKGAERMRNNTNNKNTNNKKKSKKYKKKDCVEESGIGEFVNMLQKIGYCDKRARAKPSNAMSLSPMSQASDEAIDRPDDDTDHALLKEIEQLDAFSVDEDEKSE
eukprot:860623_1